MLEAPPIRRSRAFAAVRSLQKPPLSLPLLDRFDTTRGVLGWLSRRHGDLAGPGLSPEGLAARQPISSQPEPRVASAAFATGGLGPCDTLEGWLAAARALHRPLTVVIADQTPPKSLSEMQSPAAVAGRTRHRPDRLGAHDECGRELAALLRCIRLAGKTWKVSRPLHPSGMPMSIGTTSWTMHTPM